jgi:asparagine synthase (glutamine-hydrolysing)
MVDMHDTRLLDGLPCAAAGLDDAAAQPYFHAVIRRGQVEVSGLTQASVGHRVRRQNRDDDGIFAEWRWEDGRLTVHNDRYGVHPLFYFGDTREVGVSTSLIRLLALGAPRDLDDDALAVFLRLGFFVGDDTPFRSIRAVPPNATFEWEPSRFVVTGEYVRRRPSTLNREDALEAYIELFRQAIRRRLPPDPHFVVPLSGGRDSRHILLELCHLGYKPQFCVTIPRYPPRPSEDERIASLLASEAAVPHTMLEQVPRTAAAEVRKNWQTHLCADEHTWYLPMIDYLERTGAMVYDGMGGALSVAGRFLSPRHLTLFAEGRFEELAESLLNAFGVVTEAFLDRILSPAYRTRLGRGRARTRLAQDLRLHVDAPDPTKSFNFWNRTRREIALVPYGLMYRVRAVVSPYLDRDLYALLFSLPPAIVSPDVSSPNKSFHSDAIKRAYPKYAHIPFEDSHAPRLPGHRHFRAFGMSTARHLLTCTRKRLTILDNTYVWPRLAWSLAYPGFWEERQWLPAALLYVWQLEHAPEAAHALSALSTASTTSSPLPDASAG